MRAAITTQQSSTLHNTYFTMPMCSTVDRQGVYRVHASVWRLTCQAHDASRTAIASQNCTVPVENVLGGVGNGFKVRRGAPHGANAPVSVSDTRPLHTRVVDVPQHAPH